MNRRLVVGGFIALVLSTWATVADAQSRTFNVNYTSRATFKTDAPLEAIVGTTAGQGAVTGSVTLDPARPQDAKGTVRVDLNAVKTGIDRRDTHMRSTDFLDSEASETNRWAVFEVKGVEIAGPLEPGKAIPAKIRGTLTIRGKPIETVADSTVYYLRLTPEQVESQKRFGLTAESLRITAKFPTTFTNHGMQVPQLLILKVSNDIHIETDLVLVQAQ
jgi:polyisoprenoid-binding protein YceI